MVLHNSPYQATFLECPASRNGSGYSEENPAASWKFSWGTIWIDLRFASYTFRGRSLTVRLWLSGSCSYADIRCFWALIRCFVCFLNGDSELFLHTLLFLYIGCSTNSLISLFYLLTNLLTPLFSTGPAFHYASPALFSLICLAFWNYHSIGFNLIIINVQLSTKVNIVSTRRIPKSTVSLRDFSSFFKSMK